MSEWHEYKLKDFAKIQTGPFGSQLHAHDYVSFGTPCIMPTNIGNRLDILFNTIAYVSENDTERLSKYKVKETDIVYSRRGDVEKCAYINAKQSGWLCGTGCLRIRFTSEKLSPKFCAYFLSTSEIKSWIYNNAVGTTMPNLNTTILGEVPLLLPPLDEQESIAEVLSSLDDKIDLLHRNNKTLEQLAETFFRQWFLVGAEDDWELVTLEDLCIQISSGGTPPTSHASYYSGDINWYSTKELNDNFLFKSKSKITLQGLQNSNAKLFPVGSVVIAIYAAPTVGRLGILANEAAFNQAACGFIANEVVCCSEFIYLFLKSQREELNAMATGSAQQNLNVGKIRSYPVLKPPKNIMEIFKKQSKDIFSKISSNSLQIQQLENLRDTLLPKLMYGTVRVEK